MAKFAASKKSAFTALTTPFVLADWVYAKDKKELHLLKDGTLLDDLSLLKKEYNCLSAAGQIAQDLLKTQMPGKSASALFELALAYLRKLPSNPLALAASFRLKLLTLEGLLDLSPECTQCPIPATHLYGGESFCHNHAPPLSLRLTAEEYQLLLIGGLSRSFAELASLPHHPELTRKINLLFLSNL